MPRAPHMSNRNPQRQEANPRGSRPAMPNRLTQNQVGANRPMPNRAANNHFTQNQANGAPPHDPNVTFEPIGAAPFPAPAQAAAPNPLPERLAAFAQDERNGAEFYKRLADMAGSEWDMGLLEELSENCLARSERAAALVRSQSGQPFDTEARGTGEAKLRYGDGVALAIRQESRTIDDLAMLLETMEDTKLSRTVHVMLARKMADYGKLLLLR